MGCEVKKCQKCKKRGRVIFVNCGCDISGTGLFFNPILNCDSWVTFLLISLAVALMNTNIYLLRVTQEADKKAETNF